MVIMVLFMSLFSVSVSAQVIPIGGGSTFYEIMNYVPNYSYPGGIFTVPSEYNLMTISAKAVNLGGASTAYISLASSNGNSLNYSIPADGNYHQLFTRVRVTANSSYQFWYRTNAQSAQVIIGGPYDR